jgi:hypothetical protein
MVSRMQIRAGFVWAASLVSIGALSLGVACAHKDNTQSDTPDNTPQPTQDVAMAIADDMAAHAPQANTPGDNGELSMQGDDGGVAFTSDDSGTTDQGSTATELASGPVPPLPKDRAALTLAPCGITVNFPAQVNEDDKTGDPAHQFKYPVPGATDAFFSISCTDFPNGTSDAKGWLDAARDKLDGNGGKLTSEADMTLSGNPGREVKVDLPSGGKEVARAFLLKTKSIVAIVASAPGAIPDAQVTAFLDSIRLTQ